MKTAAEIKREVAVGDVYQLGNDIRRVADFGPRGLRYVRPTRTKGQRLERWIKLAEFARWAKKAVKLEPVPPVEPTSQEQT